MTLQQTYEAIRRYFDRPDAVLAKISRPERGDICKYRTQEGNKCAIGCLISDAHYDRLLAKGYEIDNPDTDGGSLASVVQSVKDRLEDGENGDFEKLAELIGVNDEDKRAFLREAQHIHDRLSRDADDFVKRLDLQAIAFNLTVPA